MPWLTDFFFLFKFFPFFFFTAKAHWRNRQESSKRKKVCWVVALWTEMEDTALKVRRLLSYTSAFASLRINMFNFKRWMFRVRVKKGVKRNVESKVGGKKKGRWYFFLTKKNLFMCLHLCNSSSTLKRWMSNDVCVYWTAELGMLNHVFYLICQKKISFVFHLD